MGAAVRGSEAHPKFIGEDVVVAATHVLFAGIMTSKLLVGCGILTWKEAEEVVIERITSHIIHVCISSTSMMLSLSPSPLSDTKNILYDERL